LPLRLLLLKLPRLLKPLLRLPLLPPLLPLLLMPPSRLLKPLLRLLPLLKPPRSNISCCNENGASAPFFIILRF